MEICEIRVFKLKVGRAVPACLGYRGRLRTAVPTYARPSELAAEPPWSAVLRTAFNRDQPSRTTPKAARSAALHDAVALGQAGGVAPKERYVIARGVSPGIIRST